jgi:hypothetical protein
LFDRVTAWLGAVVAETVEDWPGRSVAVGVAIAATGVAEEK